MGKLAKIALFFLVFVGVISLLAIFVHGTNVAVLSPKGAIATQQRDLMVVVVLLMLIVVIPVFVMAFSFAWKYRASNTASRYTPNWDHDTKLETLWWGVPLAIIAVLSAIIYVSSHNLDPYKPLSSDKKPLTVQVVALQWKWLFIYPEQKIASLNYVQFPESTPVNFVITGDAPMNSFWIPQLGGQVYAMTGMTTKLHLISNETGSYQGSSANLSGEGFADMRFIAESTSQADFDDWVQSVQNSSLVLDMETYDQLSQPSKKDPRAFYVLNKHNLYDTIVMKYMVPMTHEHAEHGQKYHSQSSTGH